MHPHNVTHHPPAGFNNVPALASRGPLLDGGGDFGTSISAIICPSAHLTQNIFSEDDWLAAKIFQGKMTISANRAVLRFDGHRPSFVISLKYQPA
jgi:hypothetical protein